MHIALLLVLLARAPRPTDTLPVCLPPEQVAACLAQQAAWRTCLTICAQQGNPLAGCLAFCGAEPQCPPACEPGS